MQRRSVGTGKKILVICIVIAVLATVAIVFTLLRLNNGSSTTAGQVVRYSTDTPAEIKPHDDYRWTGAPTEPKKIVIPAIGIDHYIQNVGVDQRKEVAVPDNIHLAGWFVDSVIPGEKGLSIIDGHLNGPNEDGIFINLEKVKTGDDITVEFGDGSKKTFEVTGVQVVPLDSAASVLYSQDPKVSSQLNLITCGGNYNSKSRLYDKRVVVSSRIYTPDAL